MTTYDWSVQWAPVIERDYGELPPWSAKMEIHEDTVNTGGEALRDTVLAMCGENPWFAGRCVVRLVNNRGVIVNAWVTNEGRVVNTQEVVTTAKNENGNSFVRRALRPDLVWWIALSWGADAYLTTKHYVDARWLIFTAVEAFNRKMWSVPGRDKVLASVQKLGKLRCHPDQTLVPEYKDLLRSEIRLFTNNEARAVAFADACCGDVSAISRLYALLRAAQGSPSFDRWFTQTFPLQVLARCIQQPKEVFV